MSSEIPNDFEEVQGLSADERVDYLVEKASESQQIWSLHSKAGWVVQSSDGEECFPIWPSEAFAKAWATDDWADCKPKAIPLDAWIERWTPGMVKDGTILAVFPVEDDDCAIMAPDELQSLFDGVE
jgi:hypothetical protein